MPLKIDSNEVHTLCTDTAIKNFKSDSKKGLSKTQIHSRFEQFGKNIIEQKEKLNPIKIFVSQFKSSVIYILLIASLISYLLGEFLDSIVILVIVILNAVFGFVQEYRAEKSISVLRNMASPRTIVIRSGVEQEVDSKELVPGDIVLLDTGSKVPADLRIIESSSLEADESMLSGESLPVKKTSEKISGGSQISDKKNMLFMGTTITKGHAKALVVYTGMNTQMGSIAYLIDSNSDDISPLQVKLNDLGKKIGIATVIICAFIFVFAYLCDLFLFASISMETTGTLFLVAVALAVAAIPEGLPTIVTITLGSGIQKMASNNALVRRLASVETLGSCDVICTDKTGTLTMNKMTVQQMCTYEGCQLISKYKKTKSDKLSKNSTTLLFKIGVLCNDSSILKSKKMEFRGDPTEGALLVSAKNAGYSQESLVKKFPRIHEIPFDSQRKKMTTVHKSGEKFFAYTKGAPDLILKNCTHILVGGKKKKLTSLQRKKIMAQNETLAGSALRVLGFSYKQANSKMSDSQLERGHVFVGLQAMLDPPRPQVAKAIEKCRDAGIRTIMITGDFKDTAIAIASKIGILSKNGLAIDGSQLSVMSDAQLDSKIDDICIFARVSPSHKVRILSSLKRKGHIVAMTGDGVNDAPALKKADIGVAMGLCGTDVAKEASDMVLTDDNFTSITKAVEQGRHIYNSIEQFVQYTLSSNLGEVLVIFIALLLGWPLPLIAIQILWINLLTDGLPGLSLGFDSDSSNVMRNPPRKRDEGLLNTSTIAKIFLIGPIIGLATLFVFNYFGRGGTLAMSAAFTTLIIAQMFHILTYRMGGFRFRFMQNKYLIAAITSTIFLQLVVLYTPLSQVFKTTALPLDAWPIIIFAASSAYIVPEFLFMLFTYLRSGVTNNQKV